MLLVSGGMGCMFVPLTLTVVSHVAPQEAGVASSGINIGQQVGGAIGLAAIGTIAWRRSPIAPQARSQPSRRQGPAALVARRPAPRPAAAAGAGSTASGHAEAAPVHIVDQAFTAGFSTGVRGGRRGRADSASWSPLIATWTGRLRLSSAVTKGREQPCDEVLGTCEV